MVKKSNRLLAITVCIISVVLTFTGCKKDDGVNQFDGTKMGNGSGVIIDENDATGVKLEADSFETDVTVEEDEPTEAPSEQIDVEALDIPNDVEQ